jgi:hypothetical protein
MVELKTHIYKTKMEVEPHISDKFRQPIIFYMAHKNDRRNFFITFVIVDFLKNEQTFIITYTPENIEKIEKHEEERIFKMNKFSSPHCSFWIHAGKNFLTFAEMSGFFYLVDIEKGVVKVYTGKDIGYDGSNRIKEFGATFFKDPDDKNYFYLNATSRNEESGECLSNFFKVDLKLKSLDNVFSHAISRNVRAPHVTRKFKEYLLNSEFNARKYRFKKTGEIITEKRSLFKHVYENLYEQYCKKNDKKYKSEELYRLNKIIPGKLELEPRFKNFCDSKGRDFLEICRNEPELDFSVLPGEISLINLKNKTIDFYGTTYCAPAHFEIDEKNDFIYSSSHNFSNLGQRYFFGPAAIDKFLLKNGKLEKIGTFSDPSAYRLTTHKLFSCEGKSYIASFGQPNRIYFIKADTLETFYYDDIGEDVLSGLSDIGNFLNYNDLESIVLKALEISWDGKMVFFVGSDFLYVYDFLKRKIVKKIDYHPSIFVDGKIQRFYCRTTHCDYLT